MLSHVDENDRPTMVDVSGKPVSRRIAVAEARVRFPAAVADALRESGYSTRKGPVFHTATIAGVMTPPTTQSGSTRSSTPTTTPPCAPTPTP